MQNGVTQILTWMKSHRWHVLAISLACFLPVFLWSVMHIRSLYLVNAGILNQHLDAKSLNLPAGIYAAPRRLMVGQQLSPSEIKERLLRAGYEEGMQTNEFAVGNFFTLQNHIEIRTGNLSAHDALPQTVQVQMKGNSISALLDTTNNRRLKEILLPGEMLSADFNSHRQTRRHISIDEVPAVLTQALLAIEDKRFFEHVGVDWKGIVRAAWQNLQKGGIRQGASTLTQQLVKNHFLTPERTYTRKINEAMMAIALEQRLTKQQIFSLYCDRVFLGHSGMTSVYGFKQGARVYFGKELKDLSLAEAAMLVGLIKAPNRYSPYVSEEAAKSRRNVVLHAMMEEGYITPEEASAAHNEAIAVLPSQPPDAMSAPYFIDYVRREMQKLQHAEHQQVRVETTLDLDLQQAANETIQKHLTRYANLTAKKKNARTPEAALVALNPKTGEIVAMIGGRDYTASQLNRTVDAHRQPGSVFKPIVYATALSQGIFPTTTFMNEPQKFSFGHHASYQPQNYGRSYSYEPVMLREAMVRSLNVVTVEAALQVGLSNIAGLAERIGLPRPQVYPSMALGTAEATPLEIASAYTAFANRGLHVAPNAIRSIQRHGVTEAEPVSTPTRVMSGTVAYLVTDALVDVVNRGTASRVRKMGYRGIAAGKTGTSRDAWFVGYTPNLVVVVWVGHDDYADLRLTGGEVAVPIWTDFMRRAAQLRPDVISGKFEPPVDMEVVSICSTSGGVVNEYCGASQKMTLPRSMTPAPCSTHQSPLWAMGSEVNGPLWDDMTSVSEQPRANVKLRTVKSNSADEVYAQLERMNWTIQDK
jgi:penicillin-binding protein 1B